MHTYSQKNPTHGKSQRLRSVLALLLMAVFSLGQFFLSATALSSLASLAGQHQVLFSGDSVVLHHPQGQTSPHQGLAKVLVAISHADESGDHVLPCVETGFCEEPRLCELSETAPSMEIVADFNPFFEHHCLLAIEAIEESLCAAHDHPHLTELTLTHWRTVKRMV